MSVVSEVLSVPGATGGACQGARGSAFDAGEALRVPGVRKEVPEVGRPVGAQEDPRGEKVRTSRLMRPGKSNVTYGVTTLKFNISRTFYTYFLQATNIVEVGKVTKEASEPLATYAFVNRT